MRSSIGTGVACGSLGETMVFGSVTGRAGVGISATAAVETSSIGGTHANFIGFRPLGYGSVRKSYSKLGTSQLPNSSSLQIEVERSQHLHIRQRDAKSRQRSPQMNALLRRDIKFGTGSDVERLIPRIEVPQRTDNPVTSRTVRIGRDLRLDGIRSLLSAPHLRPGEKESLVTGQSIDDRSFLAFERELVSFVRDL